MVRVSSLVALAGLLALSGCITGSDGARTGSSGLIAPGGAGPIATIQAYSYDDMMVKGREALDTGRVRAAVLYFGAALTIRPLAREAVELMARAKYRADRMTEKRDEMLTETELQLPPPPDTSLSDVDHLIAQWEAELEASPVPEDGDDVPIVGPQAREPASVEDDEMVLREERPPELIPRFPPDEKGERPRLDRPSITTWIGIPARMPCRPLRTGRNNLFHTLIHIPPFESARTLPTKVWQFEGGYDGALGKLNEGSYGYGLYIRYDNNRYDEGYLKISHGFSEDIEARAEITTGNLREGDYDVYIHDQFTPYIAPYDRRADIGNLVTGLKFRLYRPVRSEPETGLTSEVCLKIPLARNPKNFTSSGMPDLSAHLMATVDLHRFLRWPRVIPSAAAGFTVPFGEIYFDRDVDLDPVFFFGVGAVIQLGDALAVVAQLQGNTSAFGEFAPLSGMVLTSHTGLRVLLGNFIIETGFGHGFTSTSSQLTFLVNIGFRFEGQELVEEILR